MKITEPTSHMHEAARFLKLLNRYRRVHGAPQLVPHPNLIAAADAKVACYVAFGLEPVFHDCGFQNSQELRESCGYTALGTEIVAWSKPTAEDVFNAWRSSPVHDAVMRDPQYRAIGVSGPHDLANYYGTWVCEFGVEPPQSKARSAADGVAQGDSNGKANTTTATYDAPIGTIPAPLRTGGTITRDTPIRLIGDCREVVARGVLDYAKSPAMAEFGAVFLAMRGHSIALLALMAKETEYGRTANATCNGWNTIDGSSPYFTAYPYWEAGTKAAIRRFTDYSYKDGVYEPEITVAQFIQTWQGGPECRTSGYARCANGETRESIELSISQFLDRANRIIRANTNTKPATPTPNPTMPEPTTPVPSEPKPGIAIRFGLVPKPANYSERIIAPGVNSAYDRLGARLARGLILHRMIGTLLGTDSWFRTGAARSALTDFGVGIGRVYRWTQPGAAITPYASGPADGIDGDGLPFWQKYKNDPIGASVFNRDCESIEVEGLTYDDPVPSADYQRLVELVAWRADSWLRIPYNRWPLNDDGVHCLLGHSEVTDQKPCPGWQVYEIAGRLIDDVRDRLEHYQLS